MWYKLGALLFWTYVSVKFGVANVAVFEYESFSSACSSSSPSGILVEDNFSNYLFHVAFSFFAHIDFFFLVLFLLLYLVYACRFSWLLEYIIVCSTFVNFPLLLLSKGFIGGNLSTNNILCHSILWYGLLRSFEESLYPMFAEVKLRMSNTWVEFIGRFDMIESTVELCSWEFCQVNLCWGLFLKKMLFNLLLSKAQKFISVIPFSLMWRTTWNYWNQI